MSHDEADLQPPASSRAWSRVVALVAMLSLAAYLATSRELRYQVGDTTYARSLIGGFLRERGLLAIRLVRPVDPAGALLLLGWIACIAITGRALVAASTDGRVRWRRGAERAVAMLFAAVVPTLVLSTMLWPDGQGRLRSLPIIAATVIVALAASLVAWRRRAAAVTAAPDAQLPDDARERGYDPGRRWAPAFVALLVPLLLAVWWNGVEALRGFDSQADHLPRAARWLVLSRLSDESGQLLTPYYPGNFLLFVRWALVLGTDAYAFIPSLAASIVCVAALYGICREMGQRRSTAIVSAACAATCSVVAYLSTTEQADTATAACLLLGVLLLVRWVRTTDRRRSVQVPGNELSLLLAFGASLGLAVGIKYSAIPPAVALFVIGAAYAWRASYQTFPDGRAFWNLRTMVLSLAAMLVPAALCGGYWLLRNLVTHGNPLYPVATMGLPGVDMRVIIPIKPALVGSAWHRLTYPWVQWDFGYVYDDGLGAAFAAVAVVGLLAMPFHRPMVRGTTRLVWIMTIAAYVLWISTGSITARFGLFPVLLSFAFVGELWRRFETVVLKVVTLAACAASVAATTFSLVVGAVYTTVLPPANSGVPRVVDSLPPSRIFNATAASNRYRLLGRDYRHEVITLFGAARPADVLAARADYVLVDQREAAEYSLALPMVLVARGNATGADTLSLWRLQGARPRPPAGRDAVIR